MKRLAKLAGRFQHNLQSGADKALAIALARAHHDAMLAKCDGLPIGVLGKMTDGQKRHVCGLF